MPMLTKHATVTVRFEDGYTVSQCRNHEGGAMTSDGIAIRPGSMAPVVAVPDTPTYDTLTVSKTLEWQTSSSLEADLRARHGMRLTVVKQPTDPRGNAGFHKPEGTGGVLIGVMTSDVDPDGTDPQVVTMTIQPDQKS